MVTVCDWLKSSCLHLNVTKTMCMFFSKSANRERDPVVMVDGQALQVVQEYKYLGVTMDSQLSFKKHIKNVRNKIKFHLVNFKHIRGNLTTEASKLYLNATILPHINYCLTSWSQANEHTAAC
ncbi:hypothetical protein NQD34_018181 [Periophthalmus magnuspinnatus]|nr:hypothetical protein NQD34_018181 [Periophthalmus magnuspinnatus]